MAVVDMTKFRLTMFASQKRQLLEKLQDFAWVDFINLSDHEESEEGLNRVDAGPELAANSEEMGRISEAIDILNQYKKKDQTLKEKYSNKLPEIGEADALRLVKEEKADQAVEEALNHQDRVNQSRNAIEKLKEEIVQLKDWSALEASLDDLDQLKRVQVKIGVIPDRWTDSLRRFASVESNLTYVEFLGSGKDIQRVFILSKEDEEKLNDYLMDINFTPVKLSGAGTVDGEIQKREEAIRSEEKMIDQELDQLKKLAQDKLFAIETAYEIKSWERTRIEANNNFLQTDRVSFLEGYVPSDKEENFREILADELDQNRYSLETKPAERENPDVPIILKNHKFFKPFEGIVKTYALPLYKEMDPTPLMAPWYMFFFGVMLADLGYGLILLALTTWALHYFDMKESTENGIRFLQIMSIPTIVTGLCFGSFLGGLVPMKALIMDPTEDVMPLLTFSLTVGVIHILVALALQAVQDYRMHEPKSAFFDVYTWYMLLVGLILFGFGKSRGWSPLLVKIFGYIALAGAVLIVAFSARNRKGGTRVAAGLYNLYGITGYIGDFASYARIMALCLSGTYIGFSFNLIASMLAAHGIPALIISIVILAFLHLFNLFLSGLSAYVHSMRLIYVEFFGKFYEGGGRAFKPLRPEAKYIDLEEEELV